MDEPKGGNPPSDQHEPFPYPDDPYDGHRPDTAPAVETALVPAQAGGGGGTPPPPPPPEDEEDEDGEGMLRMSFLEHLEELRYRIIHALMGFGVAFLACIVFANQLWQIVEAPAADALRKIGARDKLVIIDPMEGFSIIWVWTPLVATMFVAS